MKKILIPIISLLILFTQFSCKNTIDLEPISSFSSSTVWKDPVLIQAYVNEIYNEAVLTYKDAGLGWGAQTDELYSNFNWDNETQYVQGQSTPDNQNSSFPLNYSTTINFWSTLFITIQETNLFFQNISQADTTGNNPQINMLKGEVHFLRALCYFELLKRFGGVPVITKVYTSADNSFTESRTDWDSTKQYILGEINAAVPLLPTTFTNSSDEGKATVGAALALKSRLLLYAASPYFNISGDRSKWQAAADAAKAVMDMGIYSLYGDAQHYNDIFIVPFNSEVIFSRVYSSTVQDDRYNTVYRDLSPNGYNGYGAYNPLAQMTDAFDMADGTRFSWSNAAEAAHPYNNRDPRFYADILYNGASFQGRQAQFYEGGLDSKESPLSPWNASKTGYTVRKFVDSSYNFNVQPYSQCQWVVFRLAEIYLNYAEAEAELGQSGEALTYLNKIRQRAGMPAVNVSGAALIDAVRHERQIELCFEGHRYFDLRRWGLASTGAGDAKGILITPKSSADTSFNYSLQVIQTRVWDTASYFYPIPRTEIQKDPNIKQNPGYN